MEKKALKKSLAGFMVAIFFFLPLLSLPTVTVLAYEEYIDSENSKTYVFGEITENITWTKEKSPYIVTGDITVLENTTLTIEPGTEIKFDGYGKKMTIEGTLSAIGDKDNYIIFTSNQDNLYVGSWRGIELNGNANSEIRYAIIEYASTGIYCDYNSESSINLENSILRNLYYGVERIKNSNISHNDFLDINYTVFNSIYGNTNITHNYISGKYRTVFNSIYGDNSSDKIIVGYNNIDISENIEWFIKYGDSTTNFENNYWGTGDKNYIQSHIYENAINNGVSIEPYFSIPVTFDLVVLENDSLINNSTASVEFQWNPINGSGENLSHYDFYIDGVSKETGITATNTTYDFSSLSNGYHEWYVKAIKEDESVYQSNETYTFSINYQEPHPPIATVSNGECNEVDGIMWCYSDIGITLSAKNSEFITYTLDGTEPNATTSSSTFLYAESITIATSDTPIILKAKSWNTDGGDYIGSPLFEQEYQFDLIPPQAPIADPAEGLYDGSVSVALSSLNGVIIRYTTNGITPTKYSDEYVNKILINNSTVLKAIAWDEHGNKSAIMEEAYFIENSSGGGGECYYPDLKILPDQGAYIESNGSKIISLTANEETAKICYTIDGNEPTEDSTCIDDKTADVVLMTGATTLKVRAWSINGSISNISSKEYFIYDHGTYITESIFGETTWGINGSPYVIKRNTNIEINNRLTINPGVEVILNNYARIESYNGKIEALGDSDNSIIIKSISNYRDWWQSNLNISNSKLNYVKLENIYLYSNSSSVVSNSVFDNSTLRSNSSEIKNNKFISIKKESHEPNNVINLSNNTIFSNNYIENIEDKSGYNNFNAMITINGNDISILRNEFVKTDNSSDVQLFNISSGNNIKINNNNFNFDISDNVYVVKNNSEMKVDMRNNYWKGISESNIPNYIYDFYDDNSLGEVYYNTYAGSVITFDLIYPHGHALNNSNINFQWEPLVGNDVDYYELYIDDVLISDNITATNYDYSGILENESYTWYVKAIKNNEDEAESLQRFSFTIDNSSDEIIAQPNGGTYITNQIVILSHPNANTIIRYTLDNREPTIISAIYTKPIRIESSGTTVLKSKAWYGENESGISVEEYNINTTPPQINSSSAILSKSDTSYNSGTSESVLQGIVGEASSVENQTVGLIATIDKSAVCKYSLSEKEFTSINDYWYNSSEGIFKSSDGTATNLIAPLGDLQEGNYKYFIICSDGVDESKTTIEFTRKTDELELHSVLSVSDIFSIKPIATADNSWENGWQLAFDITVPDNEDKIKMKFNNWHDSNGHSINVADNMRYYSPQAEIASTFDNAIIISQTNEYPETFINLIKDINQNIEGRQIQIIVDMKIPEETSNGSYSSNYGLYSE